MQFPPVHYSDFQLSIPVFLFPIEPISERGIKFLNMLSTELYFDVQSDLAKLLEDLGYEVPQSIRAKVYIISDPADYLIMRKRLTNETSLLYLKCFTVTAFVDYSVNKNIGRARDLISSLFRSDQKSSSMAIYQAPESLVGQYSDNTCLLFAAHSDDSALANIQNHINNLLYKSIQVNIPQGGKHDSKKQFFMFLSGEKEEIFKAFQHTLNKKGKLEVKAIALEMMGLYESMYEGELKEKKFINLISSSEKLWEYDTNSTNIMANSQSSISGSSNLSSSNPIQSGNINMPQSSSSPSISPTFEDLWLYYSQSALYYSKVGNNLKVFDCAYRLLATFGNILLIDESTSYLLKSMDDPRYRNNSIDIQEKVSLRAWEMLSLLLSKNYERKVPLFAYQISEKMSENVKIDFQLQVLNLLYKQKPGDLVVRDICNPIVENLLDEDSNLNPLSKCQLALEFLSIAGPVLSHDDQDQIIHQLKETNLGDIRLPCNLGFKASNVQFFDHSNNVRIIDSDENKDTKASSPFKYSFLNNNAQSDKNTSIVSVGSHVSFSLDLFNPFLVAVQVSICAHENPNYDTNEYPHVLMPKSSTTVHCYVVPKKVGQKEDEITSAKISSIDVIFAEGVQEVKLPEELTLTIVNNIPKFVIRTNLPLHQPLHLYDGEVLKTKLWLTNNSTVPIDNLIINSKNTIKGENEVKLPILPYMSTNTDFDLTIDRNTSELAIDVIARTSSCQKAESFSKLIQPIVIEPAITINSIELLKSIPEIDTNMSNLIFLAIDIKNSSNSVFNYTAHFKAAAELGFNFPGIITKKETSGVLAENETTVFILAVEKDQIISEDIPVDNSRFINARRDEEERINQKLTADQRKVLNDRVRVTAFIESNLVFKWFCRIGRSGGLPLNTALPSLEVMKEISSKRPRLIHSFEPSKIVTNQKVALNLKFEAANVVYCKLDLGVLEDPEYGIIWEGNLEMSNTDKNNNFLFLLYFTKPGHFTFKVCYKSDEHVKGHTRIDFDVGNNDQ